MWCTYEVATFLRAKQKPILVIPVKLAVILCSFSAAEIWVMAGYYLSAYMVLGDKDTDFGQLVTFLTLVTIFYMPTLPLVFFIGISMMVEVKELPQQLRDFRVQDAKCFCCSCHHRHPETGELLPCDRELMFQMLKKWFGKAGDLEGEYMERFNQLVHEELAPRVLQDVGADVLPLNYSTYMILVALWPGLCTAIPRMVAGPTDKSISFLQHGIWILRAIMDYVMLVVLAISALRLSLRAWLIAVRFLPRWSRLACSFFMPAVLLLYLSIQWLSFQITLRFTDEDSLLPAIPFAIWTCALYCTWTSDATPNIMPSTGTQPVSEEVLPSSVGQSIFDEDSMSTFST